MTGYSVYRQPDVRRALLGPEAETMRRWLAFMRIAMGGVYIFLFLTRFRGGIFASFIADARSYAASNPLYVARWLLEGFVISNAHSLAIISMAAELALGSLLLLGLGTRLVALFGVLLHTIYLLATIGSNPVLTAAHLLFMTGLLVMFGTTGGWRWSLDEMITNRK